jgi:hypothetical protein
VCQISAFTSSTSGLASLDEHTTILIYCVRQLVFCSPCFRIIFSVFKAPNKDFHLNMMTFMCSPIYKLNTAFSTHISDPWDNIFRVSEFSFWLGWSPYKSAISQFSTSSRYGLAFLDTYKLSHLLCPPFFRFGIRSVLSTLENPPVTICI